MVEGSAAGIGRNEVGEKITNGLYDAILPGMKRIVVVGAGFVGLRVARLLKNKDPELEVFLVDKKDHFLFTPWIIDALAGDLKYEDITIDLNIVAEHDGINFIVGEVIAIDRNENTISIKTTEDTSSMAYDVLILSIGARTSYYGIPGAKEHSYPLKTSGDIRRVHEALRGLFHSAAQISDPEKRRQYLSIIVVGAGPSGIEATFSVIHYVRKLKRKGSLPKDCEVKIHVIQAGPQILPGFSEKIVDTAADELRKAGVLVLTGETVKNVDEQAMETSSGKRIPVRFTLWTAGLEASPIIFEPKPETMHGGYITVDNYLRVTDNIFAGGDITFFKHKGAPVPKTAQSAMQMAGVIVENVLRCCKDAKMKPYNYMDKGVLLTAERAGIITIGHLVTITSPLVIPIRKLLYRYRFYQMTGFWKKP